jgi:hypothetical protein
MVANKSAGGWVSTAVIWSGIPASDAGAVQTHAAYVPAEVQVCAPCWPFWQAHATLVPGTQVPLF